MSAMMNNMLVNSMVGMFSNESLGFPFMDITRPAAEAHTRISNVVRTRITNDIKFSGFAGWLLDLTTVIKKDRDRLLVIIPVKAKIPQKIMNMYASIVVRLVTEIFTYGAV
jgi:hypothetical protein